MTPIKQHRDVTWVAPTALAFLLLLVAPAIAAAQGAGQGNRAALASALQATSGRVIVMMKSESGMPAAMAQGTPRIPEAVLSKHATRFEDRGVLRNARTLGLIGAVAGVVDDAQLDALLADSTVLSVEPDQLMELSEAIPSMYSLGTMLAQDTPWGITRVQAPDAWGIVGKGAGVKVAVMDSGIDSGHPDLVVVGGYSAVTSSTASSAWQDDIGVCNGHGTHVAGTVAARDNDIGVVGIAPEASLYAIKVFEVINGGCSAWVSSQIAGLNWAVSQGIRVVNVSIGGSSMNTAYSFAIDNAVAAGTFVVASAGNNGGGVLYPAKYASSIAVAALNSSNTRPSWSSFGPEVDIAAPGEGISSTMPGGGYGGKSGTSMAAPHVTGVVALLLAQNPSLTLDGIRAKFQAGALDLGAPGRDDYYGQGLIQLVPMVGGGTPPPPPPPVPLALSVSPTSRSASAQAGTAAPADSATVTLSGDNSSSTAWTASKKKAWTTLTSANGTGSGKVKWNRSTSGLSAGTYVDTITVSAAGVSSKTVIDTLIVTPAPVPLALSVSPSSRSASAQAGTAAPADSATVTLSGDNSSSTAWTATKKKGWTTLTAANGAGSGKVKWNRSTSGLAAGTYVDTITVSVAGLAPKTVIDTLIITAAPVPLALAVSPTSRSASAQAGAAAPADSATVTLTGDNSSSTAWTATKKKGWTTLTAANGTGSGKVKWNRSTSGLAAGTYVDTITVSAAGVSSKTVIDTLIVTPAPVPLALSVSPSSRSASAQVGTAAPGDAATVTLTGDNSGSTAWTATKKKGWTTLTTANGTGSGTVAWNRSTSGLATGTYVDTITVSVAGLAPKTVIDTLTITAAPVPLALSVSPSSRSASAQVGAAAPGDQATVTLTGDNSGSTAWTATKKKGWTTLTTANGTGSGTVAWNRSTSGLAAGTYVDTITVSVAGLAPKTVIDTLVITAAPVPLALSVSPNSRSVSVQTGAAAPADSATVTLTGDNSGSTSWTAGKKKGWTILTNANGTGPGKVKWNRSTSGLAAGTYVDTISVSVAGLAPKTVIDTLIITAAPVVEPPPPAPVLTVTLSPSSRLAAIPQGNGWLPDSAALQIAGGTPSWSVSAQQGWTSLSTSSGTGSATIGWRRRLNGLAPGTYVDTITVAVEGAASQQVIDSLIILPVEKATLSKGGGKTKVLDNGNGRRAQAGGDTTVVTVATTADIGGGAQPPLWTATTTANWITVIKGGNTPSTGEISWARQVESLTVGRHIDSVVVTLTTNPAIKGTFVDTVDVVLVNEPTPEVAVDGLFRSGPLNGDQLLLFDAIGNRNGRYDLGDFLAWVEKNKLRLSPSTVARLSEVPLIGP